MFFSKIIIFITVIFAMIFPGNPNGATLEVTNEVTTIDSVIEYTYKNDTGYVIANDCWVSKLEIKVLDTWQEVPVADEVEEPAFYVNPVAEYSGSYDAVALLPGTYRLTVSYNVCTSLDATEVGSATAEFTVTSGL